MEKRKPQEWEYFASTIESKSATHSGRPLWLDEDDKPLSDSLDEMGKAEWELVCSVPIDAKTFTLIYKKPKAGTSGG
jgi:hypothetical protein